MMARSTDELARHRAEFARTKPHNEVEEKACPRAEAAALDPEPHGQRLMPCMRAPIPWQSVAALRVALDPNGIGGLS